MENEFKKAIDHIMAGKPLASIAAASTKTADGVNVQIHIDGSHPEVIFTMANLIWRMHELTGIEASEICDDLKIAMGIFQQHQALWKRS